MEESIKTNPQTVPFLRVREYAHAMVLLLALSNVAFAQL